jgi:hypothetical protein
LGWTAGADAGDGERTSGRREVRERPPRERDYWLGADKGRPGAARSQAAWAGSSRFTEMEALLQPRASESGPSVARSWPNPNPPPREWSPSPRPVGLQQNMAPLRARDREYGVRAAAVVGRRDTVETPVPCTRRGSNATAA